MHSNIPTLPGPPVPTAHHPQSPGKGRRRERSGRLWTEGGGWGYPMLCVVVER